MAHKFSFKTILLLFLSAFFFLLIIPHLINKAYDIGGFYETNWGAGDVLSFYGSVLGGFTTLMAIYITIRRENRIRRQDVHKQKSDNKLQQVRNALLAALQTLDSSHIVIINIPHDNPSPAIDKLNHYLVEVRRLTTIDILFDFEQSEILKKASSKIKLYVEKYSNLITDFIKVACSHTEYEVYKSYARVLELLNKESVKNYNEIKRIEQNISGINCRDLNQIDQENEKARMEIVNFSNEKYNSMYDVVIEGIKKLEQFYETQLETIK